MDHERDGVHELLQHILSMREQKYEASTLKGHIHWAWDCILIAGAQVAFEVSTWEAVGQMLWDCVVSGGGEVKEVSKYATLWKTIIEVLRAMKVERKATAAACAAIASDLNPKPQAFPVSSVHQLFSTTLDTPSRSPQPLSPVSIPNQALYQPRPRLRRRMREPEPPTEAWTVNQGKIIFKAKKQPVVVT